MLNNLARVARDLEDWDRVAALAGESLALFQELGDRRGVAWVLSNLTVVAGRRGFWEQAARLHGAAEALREAIGAAALGLSPAELAAHEAAVAAARAGLGDSAFAAPWRPAGRCRRRRSLGRAGEPPHPGQRRGGTPRPAHHACHGAPPFGLPAALAPPHDRAR